jgi:alpha-mannosidase
MLRVFLCSCLSLAFFGGCAPNRTSTPSEPPMTTTTKIVSARTLPVLLRGGDGGETQQVELVIEHTGADVQALVKAGGGAATRVQLTAGEQTVTIAAPKVDKPTPVSVVVETADTKATLAQGQVELKPVRPWVIYLLAHSHVDIGYTDLQARVEEIHRENLAHAIEIARATADYPNDAQFRWNVEVMWPVDVYLQEATPEQRQAFFDAVKAGWIELDALYGNELTGLCRPEELIRLVEYAQKVSRECGVPLRSAMITDVPGYTWGIVPVLAQAGVKFLSIGPNDDDRIGHTLSAWGDKAFYWLSPSGRERVFCWMANGYSYFHRGYGGSRLDEKGKELLLAYLERLEQADYPYDLVQLRYSIGGDNGPPDPDMSDFVRDWNETHVYPHLVIATTTRMCADFEARYGDRIPQVRGDFTPYWSDGAASSARETALNRETAERLVQAETLFAMLAPQRYSAKALDEAWRNVLLYDEHTWGADISIDEPDAPFVKQQWAVKQAYALDAAKQSRELLAEALGERPSGAGEVTAIDVFNTSSWPRTGLVTLPKELATAGDVVKDPDGAAVPSQRLSTGELAFLASDVPPFGCVRYSCAPDRLNESGQARAEGTTLTTPRLSVRVDETTGAIVSLRDANGTEFVDADAAVGVNGYRYMLGSDRAGAQGNGPAKVSVKEAGPLVASLLVESDAPGCRKLVREVRVIAGLDYIEIIDTVDKEPVREKEGVHFGFAFNVPDGVMRMDVAWAVFRPEADQIPGACKNWFTIQRWVDVSNDERGVTWATPDAPLVEVGAMTADRIGSLNDPSEWLDHIAPSQTLYSWAMNNHWHTNYRAEQEGPTVFRYVLEPHGAFDAAAAQRFGIERSQPLIAAPATDAAPFPGLPFVVESQDVIVTSLKPTAGGRAWLVRLYNPTAHAAHASITWRTGQPQPVRQTDLFGTTDGSPVQAIELPPWGFTTVRSGGR